MGKVYDALKKAEGEGHRASWSALSVDNRSTRPSTPRERNNGAKEMDFIDYSLNAPDANEIEERNREMAVRRSLMQPTREVSIDTTRIASQLIYFQGVDTDAAEEYNKLAVKLITTAGERPLKRVLVASAQHGEGRTSITLNLACALAKAQRRVLVVDTDLHRPSFLRLLGLSAEVGLNDALSKGLSIGSAVIRIQPFGFNLLPTREQVKNPAELLSSFSFTEMLELLEPDYDFILFDSPPLLRVADSSLLIRHTHATVLVIRSGKTSSGEVGRAIAPLAPEKILGVVLNRADRAT
jgi:capsular exopolysaccharide synthesis family protein